MILKVLSAKFSKIHSRKFRTHGYEFLNLLLKPLASAPSLTYAVANYVVTCVGGVEGWWLCNW
jgi:hypothetical protein